MQMDPYGRGGGGGDYGAMAQTFVGQKVHETVTTLPADKHMSAAA